VTTYEDSQRWLENTIQQLHRAIFQHNDRLVFVQRQGDVYVQNQSVGLIIRNLQIMLNEIDISNSFVILLSNNSNLHTELAYIKTISQDPVPITGIIVDDGEHTPVIIDKQPMSLKEFYQYGSVNPLKISLSELSKKEEALLTTSKVFCIYPWIHLNASPTGDAMPCCMAAPESGGIVGNSRSTSLVKIWNNDKMKQLRTNMLTEQPSGACNRCYEQEQSGFFSGRQSANKHHGHHISRVLETAPDGTLDRFEMVYWDIRFSNLCNLRCRSCGHIYSSQWYKDQVELAGPNWAKMNTVLNYAGKNKNDMWEQLSTHIPYVEQIYFAGGEPLIMEEHYNILDELELRKSFDVRLVYNTNFNEVHLKNRTVFDYWKKFNGVSVGASLDAMGARAEYIRKGSDWDKIERNRELMLKECPRVDFYISCTLSIMNALHITDFHRSWVDRGYIQPQDFNVNILLDPHFYRIDIATPAYKQQIKEKFEEHLAWLRPLDRLNRATQGFESAINFLTTTDNSNLLPMFWAKTRELDIIRKENVLTAIPELKALL
jgi:MoaA/NifB/PqqE/SkfB family radical SAM enzyme